MLIGRTTHIRDDDIVVLPPYLFQGIFSGLTNGKVYSECF
jgi:hypothetical protein